MSFHTINPNPENPTSVGFSPDPVQSLALEAMELMCGHCPGTGPHLSTCQFVWVPWQLVVGFR